MDQMHKGSSVGVSFSIDFRSNCGSMVQFKSHFDLRKCEFNRRLDRLSFFLGTSLCFGIKFNDAEGAFLRNRSLCSVFIYV